MRQLDACDFCGDAADGVYEVVPAAVAGESRRLALCADCRATLQSVVDPLLDAAGTPTAASPDPDSGRDADTDDSADGAPSVEDDAVVIDSGSDTEQEAATDHVDESDVDVDADADTDAGSRSKRRPSGYAQVIRLLQNRDGAMPRDDLRALATNAYDLGGREFDEAVEAAIENGDVEESPAGLRTT